MDVTAGSPRKVWWRCGESPDHEWAATIANRTRIGSGRSADSSRLLAVVKRMPPSERTVFPLM
jgi:hypothetical protein